LKPLRVLYLIDSLGPGGAQRQLVTLVNGLDRRHVSPTVAIYHPLFHFRPALEKRRIPIVQLGLRGAKDPRVLVRLAGLLRRERFDLVHSYLRIPGVFARIAALGLPTRVIVSERNVDLGHRRRDLILERPLVNRTPAVIANADAIKRHAETLLPGWRGRVHVVPNGIDWSPPTSDDLRGAESFRAKQLDGGRYLLGVVGRIQPQKDPMLLLDALSSLPSETLDTIRVAWIGLGIDRELTAAFERRIQSAPLADRVVLLPPTRNVRRVYLGIDALILPSRWEGFPNVLLEAMADARPAIATDVGDVRSMVEPERSGWVVPPGDAAALGRAIEALVGTPRERLADMGRAGAAHVREEFSVSNLVRRTMNVYHLVLDRGDDHAT